MSFKTLLVYIPVADFTQPHVAIPYLAGYLRDKGEDVAVKDLNIEAHQFILSVDYLKKCYKKVNNRFTSLNEKDSLDLREQKEYMNSLEALGLNREIIPRIEEIKQGFRSGAFYDYREYRKNIGFLEQAFKLVSCAHFPTQIEAAEYSTPFFLNTDDDIMEQTDGTFNPFMEFYETHVIPYIEKETPDLIGMSVTYSSQTLQMFALAHLIKKRFPGIHICAGGAFLCRMVLNMKREKFKTLFGCLDSTIVYEGENALYNLVSYLKENDPEKPFSMQNVIYHDKKNDAVIFPPEEAYVEDPNRNPPPDFDGFPLEEYLSPELILPYAPTRGCYWDKCAFCHYGATRERTARYRETGVEKIMGDLDSLAGKYKVNKFAFSVDIMSPSLALSIADEMIKRGRPYHWNTDIRFEENYTEERCRRLKEGGCHAIAIGLESGNERILGLMEKGITPRVAERVVRNFSNAGICVQVMTFLDFPTETAPEALDTIDFISRNREFISLFTMGDFEMLYGSRVFRNPGKYGVKRVYYPKGDEFRILSLYEEERQSKTEMGRYSVDSAYIEIAEKFCEILNPYAGAVSTNHTFLYFEQFGKDVFKQLKFDDAPEPVRSNRKFKKISRPRLNPDHKVLDGNFSIRELEQSLEANADFLREKTFEGGESARRAMDERMSRVKVFPEDTLYVLVEDLRWAELSGQVKEILEMCDGKKNFKRIVKSVPKPYRDSLKNILNQLLSINILK